MSEPESRPYDDSPPRWRVNIVIVGLILLAVLYIGIPVTNIFIKPLPPDPEPVLNVTATWGDFDEVCLYQYYAQEQYPENPARRGLLIDYEGREYICLAANGLCSTNEGDCWEAVYRLHEK